VAELLRSVLLLTVREPLLEMAPPEPAPPVTAILPVVPPWAAPPVAELALKVLLVTVSAPVL
jgi:hypothetical protein